MLNRTREGRAIATAKTEEANKRFTPSESRLWMLVSFCRLRDTRKSGVSKPKILWPQLISSKATNKNNIPHPISQNRVAGAVPATTLGPSKQTRALVK